MVIGFAQGTFDVFHRGHLNLLLNARKHCDYLIVGVNADSLVEQYKNKTPIHNEEDRKAIVAALKCVDEVIITTTLDKMDSFEKIHYNKLFIGDDWKGNPRWVKTEQEMNDRGVEIVWLPYTQDVSSTMVREKMSSTGV